MNRALHLRWPQGVSCPWRGQGKAWPLRTTLLHSTVGRQTSVTAGTIFHKTQKPLRPWVRALWFPVLSYMIIALVSCGTGTGTGTETVTNPHSVDLSWTPSTSPVVGYNVYRSTNSNGPYDELNPNLVSSTSYTDQTVANGATYYYVTTAVDAQGVESAYSNQAVAVIPQ